MSVRVGDGLTGSSFACAERLNNHEMRSAVAIDSDSFPVTEAAPVLPKLQIGNAGDPGSAIPASPFTPMYFSAQPFTVHLLVASL